MDKDIWEIRMYTLVNKHRYYLCYWKWQFIVSFPIKDADFSIVIWITRGCVNNMPSEDGEVQTDSQFVANQKPCSRSMLLRCLDFASKNPSDCTVQSQKWRIACLELLTHNKKRETNVQHYPIGSQHHPIIIKLIWLVAWNILYFSIYWECHHPIWRTHIFQRGRSTTNLSQKIARWKGLSLESSITHDLKKYRTKRWKLAM